MNKLLALLMLVLPLFDGQARAAAFADKTFAQLVAEADQIFIGTVSSLESRKLSSRVIVTDVRFSSTQVLKGEDRGGDIVLLVLGGEVGGSRLDIPGVPRFGAGERYLVFSEGNGRDMFPVVGGPAGLFRIVAGPAGATTVMNASGKTLSTDVVAEVLGSIPSQAQKAPALPLQLFVDAINARLPR